MSFAKKYPKEVKQILAKYPLEYKRSAVMPLLYLAEREEGYITKDAMQDIAETLEISLTMSARLLASIPCITIRRKASIGCRFALICRARCVALINHGIVVRQSRNQSR